MIKKKEEIKKELELLKSDIRLTYKPALVFVNGPLALIQTELSSKIRILEWVLGEEYTSYPYERTDDEKK